MFVEEMKNYRVELRTLKNKVRVGITYYGFIDDAIMKVFKHADWLGIETSTLDLNVYTLD